ncbi:uncharacterized protein LOC142605932 [Castanea sativa]|uniref:uncharacterized protein LOC142605932 n=1 Tax=Castanea sativa TaxID=21020 RepID=UPI003F64F3D8
MVVVDDFSRYILVEFHREKSEACEKMEILCKRLQNEKGAPIVKIRSDHGMEFENVRFEFFCEKNGIMKEFSAPKTPQQNVVVERKKRKPKVKYFLVFKSKCYILNDRENLGKFDAKSDEGIFLGYSTTSRAYVVFNKRTNMVMESINVVIDDAITRVEIDDDRE